MNSINHYQVIMSHIFISLGKLKQKHIIETSLLVYYWRDNCPEFKSLVEWYLFWHLGCRQNIWVREYLTEEGINTLEKWTI